jgi:preprotein translocase subunit SecG
MSFLAGVLIFFLVVTCAALILLVLMQLPKKDAGAGLAFGGGAADALFGAGSGNFLTQATKYAVVAFCLLCLILGYVEVKIHGAGNASDFTKAVQEKQQMQPPIVPPPLTAPAVTPPVTAPTTNNLLSLPMPVTSGTNSPAAPAPAK